MLIGHCTILVNLVLYNLYFFIFPQVKPHLEAGAINNIIDKAMGDNYKLESIWKVAEIAVMSIQPFGVNRPTMRQVVSDLREAIAMETSMQYYDGSSISMQSDQDLHQQLLDPQQQQWQGTTTTTTIFQVPAPMSDTCPSEIDKLQTNIPRQAAQISWACHMQAGHRK
jgi:hypothetical protein